MSKYSLPDLRYDYGALEPHISGRIMELHHDKHHANYVKGANSALDRLAAGEVLNLAGEMFHALAVHLVRDANLKLIQVTGHYHSHTKLFTAWKVDGATGDKIKIYESDNYNAIDTNVLRSGDKLAFKAFTRLTKDPYFNP